MNCYNILRSTAVGLDLMVSSRIKDKVQIIVSLNMEKGKRTSCFHPQTLHRMKPTGNDFTALCGLIVMQCKSPSVNVLVKFPLNAIILTGTNEQLHID